MGKKSWHAVIPIDHTSTAVVCPNATVPESNSGGEYELVLRMNFASLPPRASPISASLIQMPSLVS
jgi:hypothetical protein